MTTVDLVEAQCQLHDLLSRVEQGEDVALTRDGHPVARLEPSVSVTGQHVADAAAVLGTHWQNHMLGCHPWARD